MTTETNVIKQPSTSRADNPSKDKIVKLKHYQAQFIRSARRHPAMVSAWGTGKSMCGIGRAMMLSDAYPKNLGVIFRKEFTDLRDSTLKDFEEYTALKIDSTREIHRPNGSVIMFRHLEELNNIQNMNLGWYWIEQAEELETDKEFVTLMGRLRRKDVPHSGFITANVKGKNWIYELFKLAQLADSELIEAKTFDNADNLPEDFIKSLETVKATRPEIYARFVENDWNIADDELIVLPYDIVKACVDNKIPFEENTVYKRHVTVADIAGESEKSDETVIYDLIEGTIKDQEIYRGASHMDTVGRIQAHAQRNGSRVICVDKVGEGAGTFSRLKEVYETDSSVIVYGFDGRLSAPEGLAHETYGSYKAYAWFKAADYFRKRIAAIPDDKILIKQLVSVPYKYTSGGGGKRELVDKDKIKKLLGGSPDRADAYVMGLDALEKCNAVKEIDLQSQKRNKTYIPEVFRNVKRDRFAIA